MKFYYSYLIIFYDPLYIYKGIIFNKMNNLYNMFKKILPGKDSEKKLKEEEDPNAEINLAFEINPLKSIDILNNCTKDLKIGGAHIESFDFYNKGLNKLIAQYKNSTRDLDYRYSKIAEKEGSDLSNILTNLFYSRRQ